MNREYVLWNLREAKKSLDSTISQIERDPFYEDEDLIACVKWIAFDLRYRGIKRE